MSKQIVKAILDLVDKAQIVFDNVKNQPDLAEIMATILYDITKMQEGETLLEALKQKNQLWLVNQAKQKEATFNFQTQWKQVKKTYKQHVQLARALLLNHPELLARLGLEGARKQSFSGLLSQMRQFYTESQADNLIGAILAGGGLIPELLQTTQTAIETAVHLHSHQQDAISRAQAATPARNEAAETLRIWLKRFWLAATFALQDNPQRLEALGKKI